MNLALRLDLITNFSFAWIDRLAFSRVFVIYVPKHSEGLVYKLVCRTCTLHSHYCL